MGRHLERRSLAALLLRPAARTFFAAEEVLAGWEDAAPVPADHGWSALAAETAVVPIPGNHVTLIRDPGNVRVLAAKIESATIPL